MNIIRVCVVAYTYFKCVAEVVTIIIFKNSLRFIISIDITQQIILCIWTFFLFIPTHITLFINKRPEHFLFCFVYSGMSTQIHHTNKHFNLCFSILINKLFFFFSFSIYEFVYIMVVLIKTIYGVPLDFLYRTLTLL